MALVLTKDQYAEIERHGEEAFPHECCGFILGAEENGSRIVRQLIPAGNAREVSARNHRFLIDPREFMEAEERARAQGVDLIGFYHSHPDATAHASQYDREHAWPWYSYVIVSIMERKADHMYSWILKDDRSAFDEEPILVAS